MCYEQVHLVLLKQTSSSARGRRTRKSFAVVPWLITMVSFDDADERASKHLTSLSFLRYLSVGWRIVHNFYGGKLAAERTKPNRGHTVRSATSPHVSHAERQSPVM